MRLAIHSSRATSRRERIRALCATVEGNQPAAHVPGVQLLAVRFFPQRPDCGDLRDGRFRRNRRCSTGCRAVGRWVSISRQRSACPCRHSGRFSDWVWLAAGGGCWRRLLAQPQKTIHANPASDMNAASDLEILLRNLRPALNPGRYAFVSLPAGAAFDTTKAIAFMREPEGLSLVLPEQVAIDRGLTVAFSAAWITLSVHSDLAAVGLTAAFSNALSQAGISCNVMAGVHHDHLFVPFEQAQAAMDALHELQQSAR